MMERLMAQPAAPVGTVNPNHVVTKVEEGSSPGWVSPGPPVVTSQPPFRRDIVNPDDMVELPQPRGGNLFWLVFAILAGTLLIGMIVLLFLLWSW